MKIELIDEEIGIVKDLLQGEFLNLCMQKNNKYIDLKQIDSMCNKLTIILDKFYESESTEKCTL